MAPELAAIGFGLVAAAGWGASDFAGGLATRRVSAAGAVFWVEVFGLGIPVLAAIWFGEPFPGWRLAWWSAVTGASGAFGLVMLYRGLSEGRMGVVAPLSAVIAALMPILAGFINEGLPGKVRVFGFAAALVAVWLLSGERKSDRAAMVDIRYGLIAGVGFGVYFIMIDYISKDLVFWPLVWARTGGAILTSLILLAKGLPRASKGMGLAALALAGVLDGGATLSFSLAAKWGRLDISAALASMYPTVTVLLAWFVLRERLTARQWSGVGSAVVALALIAH